MSSANAAVYSNEVHHEPEIRALQATAVRTSIAEVQCAILGQDTRVLLSGRVFY